MSVEPSSDANECDVGDSLPLSSSMLEQVLNEKKQVCPL